MSGRHAVRRRVGHRLGGHHLGDHRRRLGDRGRHRADRGRRRQDEERQDEAPDARRYRLAHQRGARSCRHLSSGAEPVGRRSAGKSDRLAGESAKSWNSLVDEESYLA